MVQGSSGSESLYGSAIAPSRCVEPCGGLARNVLTGRRDGRDGRTLHCTVYRRAVVPDSLPILHRIPRPQALARPREAAKQGVLAGSTGQRKSCSEALLVAHGSSSGALIRMRSLVRFQLAPLR
jgi:hypothetical protein